ncbi:MAG: hypothetical protein JNK04_12440, partial [Myxococcales bacterium]|nr:hypothetical protein [Myxococcales bacterium]
SCLDCPDDPNSCSTCECGSIGGSCYCDEACITSGDCCANAVAFCGLSGNPVDMTCDAIDCGTVGGEDALGNPCYCDDFCVTNGDCCANACATCGYC